MDKVMRLHVMIIIIDLNVAYHNVSDAIIHCKILFDLKAKKENRVNYTDAELVFRLFIPLSLIIRTMKSY